MGLWLSFEVFDFFLNAGVTSATFKSDRKIEFPIQKFTSEFSFRIFVGISLCYIVAVCGFLISLRTFS